MHESFEREEKESSSARDIQCMYKIISKRGRKGEKLREDELGEIVLESWAKVRMSRQTEPRIH